MSLLACLATFCLHASLGTELPIDPPLAPGAHALKEPGRYQATRSYEETLDFYRRLFNQTGGVRWRNIVNLPGIKAKHVASLRNKTRWEGLNIYEKQGDVRIYVLLRDAAQADNESPTSAPPAQRRPASRKKAK